jgi:hypothetical protein
VTVGPTSNSDVNVDSAMTTQAISVSCARCVLLPGKLFQIVSVYS